MLFCKAAWLCEALTLKIFPSIGTSSGRTNVILQDWCSQAWNRQDWLSWRRVNLILCRARKRESLLWRVVHVISNVKQRGNIDHVHRRVLLILQSRGLFGAIAHFIRKPDCKGSRYSADWFPVIPVVISSCATLVQIWYCQSCRDGEISNEASKFIVGPLTLVHTCKKPKLGRVAILRHSKWWPNYWR